MSDVELKTLWWLVANVAFLVAMLVVIFLEIRRDDDGV